MLAVLLAWTAACRDAIEGFVDATDPTLAGPFDPAQLEFLSSRPAFVEQHDVDLLHRFAGLGVRLTPRTEFSRNWDQTSAWSVGEMTSGDFGFRYVKVEPFVFCFGNVKDKLGWSSSAAPDQTNWLETQLVRKRGQTSLQFDAARLGRDTVVLVRDALDGLLEIDFQVSGGTLVERSRRLVSPDGEDPMLLQVGPDLLLFWWKASMVSSRPHFGGRTLYVERRSAESDGWAQPAPLTIDLAPGGRHAVACQGDQVVVAWPDDRYARLSGFAFERTGKVFVATSPDRGRTWSTPRCVQDPETKTYPADLVLLPCGERWLLLALDNGVFPKPEAPGDTLALSRDLTRWAILPGEQHDALVRAAEARLTHD